MLHLILSQNIINIRPNNNLIRLISFNLIVIKFNNFNPLIKMLNSKQKTKSHAFGFICLNVIKLNNVFSALFSFHPIGT